MEKLKEAVAADTAQDYTRALVLYKEGIEDYIKYAKGSRINLKFSNACGF
jgi:hypothetical protein